MAWLVEFKPTTERDRVGTVIATWTEPDPGNEVFVFTDEQINTNNAAQKTSFINRAKSRLAEWQTNLNKDKADVAAVKTELEAGLNA